MRRVLHKLLNRVFIISFVVMLQAAFVCLELIRFSENVIFISSSFRLLSIIVVFFIIYKKNTKPAIKLAWVVPILLFPLLGGILYIFFGNLFVPPGMKKNIAKTDLQIKNAMKNSEDDIVCLYNENSDICAQYKYLSKYAPSAVKTNTSCVYFDDGKPYWESLCEDLKQAKEFIFIEYFIISSGVMWDSVLEILKQKVSEGVEVRLMYDDLGSAMDLPNKYFSTIEQMGIKCVAFNRIIPFFALILNNRDHRKIVVIDGKIGYTGGINLADEYINKKARFGYWKDSGLKLTGDAVWNLTVLFLQMWNISRYTDDDFEKYKRIQPVIEAAEGYVAPYGDSPLDKELVGENVYINMINDSEKYVWIYTPYLIMDDVLTESLKLACKRGVDVRIVTPGIPDKKTVFYMTRNSYLPLIEAGARIYEYTPGFIHAKCTLCDDELANIGSINYDYRSFNHNYEIGVLMYKTGVEKTLKKDMLNTFEKSTEITEEYIRSRKFNINIMGPILHLFAPLL